MLEPRCSDDLAKRDIPSFIEPRPPLISNPFMRPRPQKGTNLLELFEEDSEFEEPELVQVYLRMKPSAVPNNLYEVRSDHCLITSLDTAPAGHGRRTQHNVSKMYTFSHIFGPDATQKELFENIIKDNLRKLPEGHSFTLLTYGASGSGKTYTLMGTVQSPGLVPRSLEYLFRIIDAAQQPQYKPAEGGADKLNYAEQNYELQWVKHLRRISAPLRDKYRRMSVNLVNDMTHSTVDLSSSVKHYVWVSFVEIYNEGIYDLLVAGDRRASSTLRIREDSSGNVFVQGATQAFVRSGEEAYDVMMAGKHNLQVAATGVHAHSSRSHCIFTITVLTESDGNIRSSCGRLCDLAGCERARKTRNIGARMQESRAINSSLHVLERCLHTLRRRQRRRADTHLVPYRESKLTRLLGSGLSGARGEAVSMVVTVNPSPEYAHETKHVLQMAAVARDIQINNTIMEPSLLSTTKDTTISSSEEVVRLRAENERLHFELIQAQSRNKELRAAMEQNQRNAATMMTQVVEDAKDMTREYYETQLQLLREQMEDMREEYESRLNTEVAVKPVRTSETPNHHLHNKIAQLITEKAILEDNLTAEKLAKESAEQEVQYLLGCIEERDEKNQDVSPITNDEDLVSLTDSEDEENDICNESLEPRFKKEDINRSRLLLRQSLLNNAKNCSNLTVNHTVNEESALETFDNTIKDNDNTLDEHDSTYVEDNDDKPNINMNRASSFEESGYDLAQESEIIYKTIAIDTENLEKSNAQDTPVTVKKRDSLIRGTYFVRKSQDNSDNYSFDHNVNDKIDEFVSVLNTSGEREEDPKNISGFGKHLPQDSFEEDYSRNNTPPVNNHHNSPQTVISKFNKSAKISSIDTSLAQFEQLELAAKNCVDQNNSKVSGTFIAINALKGKKIFFDDVPKSSSTDNNSKINKNLKENDDETEQKEDSILNKIAKNKMTLYSNTPHNPQDNAIKIIEIDTKNKETKTFDDKSLKAKYHQNNSKEKPEDDLKQEEVTKVFDDNNVIDVDKILKSKGKNTYFDNLDTNLHVHTSKESRVDQIKNSKNDDRSPSIVKEVVSVNVELITIKKLLGESSVNKLSTKPNKQNSMDLFESPQITVKPKEDLELIATCVEKLPLDNKSSKHNKDTIPKVKIDYASSVEESINESRVNDHINQNNNTVEDFEKIYNNITAPRATEFDMLISQSEINETDIKTEFKEPKLEGSKTVSKYNLRKTQANSGPEITDDKENINNFEKKQFEVFTSDKIETKKYKLRSLISDEVLLEASAKCESKPTKRNLRLRRRKNRSEDDETDNFSDKSKDNVVNIENDANKIKTNAKDKLKEIVNLRSEFSDVTMGVPAPVKEAKDITSPEKIINNNENMQPLAGIQSCPSKSVTRSRRKLFTPRAEPLEESLTQADSNERINVPRPSYHRPRARRKL